MTSFHVKPSLEQHISFIPASSSTPVNSNNQKSGTLASTLASTHLDNTPAERQHKEDIFDKIYVEEGAENESALSTISSLNTEENQALDKVFG